MPKRLTSETALHWAQQTMDDVKRQTSGVDCAPTVRNVYLEGIKTGFMEAVATLRLQGYLVENEE